MREQLPDDLVTERRPGIVVRDLEVALKEIDDGQVRSGLVVRIRAGLEDSPAMGLMATGKLVTQAGLPHPGLAHQPHHLPSPWLDLRQQLVQDGELRRPTHKSTQRARVVPCQPCRLRLQTDDKVRDALVWRPKLRWDLLRAQLTPSIHQPPHLRGC
jgi:hypothetical protein